MAFIQNSPKSRLFHQNDTKKTMIFLSGRCTIAELVLGFLNFFNNFFSKKLKKREKSAKKVDFLRRAEVGFH